MVEMKIRRSSDMEVKEAMDTVTYSLKGRSIKNKVYNLPISSRMFPSENMSTFCSLGRGD